VQTVERRRLDQASDLLKTLAAPVRLALLVVLAAGARCVHELVDELGVSQPLVSQHLRVLRAAGLVAGARHHRQVDYHLVDGHVAHIVRDALAHAGHGAGDQPDAEQASPAGWSAARATMA
jgi:DNA-binding transcriptional ArsR family regulator